MKALNAKEFQCVRIVSGFEFPESGFQKNFQV